MPVQEIKRLSAASEKAQVDAAISACIAEEIRNGRDQEQASAMCYQMASDQTGQDLTKGG